MLDLDLSSLFSDEPQRAADPTVRILTVCTGNICRSPLAEQLLAARLADLDVTVASAGTRGLVEKPMTPDAARLAAELGIPAPESAAHRARWLDESHLDGVDLVLAMSREHRSAAVALAPARTRAAFTAREFARLADGVDDAAIASAAAEAGADPHTRVRAALALLALRRAEVDAPADPTVDDVVDPYRRSWDTYQLSARQLLPGIDAVVRVLRAALT